MLATPKFSTKTKIGINFVLEKICTAVTCGPGIDTITHTHAHNNSNNKQQQQQQQPQQQHQQQQHQQQRQKGTQG